MSRRSKAGVTAVAAIMAVFYGQAAHALETRGFAISWFQPAYYPGDEDCPDGVTQEIDWKAVFAKEGKSPQEIAALFEHPLSPEFQKAALNRGPHGENVCVEPGSIVDTSWRTVKGKSSHGMNLDGTSDGRATATTCQHDKFTGVDGAPSVDNQLYRVMGCSKIHRGSLAKDGRDAFAFQYLNERMREGLVTYVIEITGIQNPRNTDNVDVAIYQGTDPLIQDGAGGVQADSSIRITSDVRWQSHVHGSIKDGIITTDPFDFDLRADAAWLPEFHFRKARLKLEMQPDGSLKGHLGGYQDWATIFWGLAKTGFLLEKFSTGNCPAIYNAFQRMADGDKDPKTGQCTTISTDYGIEAVPAFLIHPTGSKTAQRAEPTQTAQTR